MHATEWEARVLEIAPLSGGARGFLGLFPARLPQDNMFTFFLT